MPRGNIYMWNFPHEAVRFELNCGEAKSFNCVNLSSLRDDRVDNGMFTHVVFEKRSGFIFESTVDAQLIRRKTIERSILVIVFRAHSSIWKKNGSIEWREMQHLIIYPSTSRRMDVILARSASAHRDLLITKNNTQRRRRRRKKISEEQLSMPLDNRCHPRERREDKNFFLGILIRLAFLLLLPSDE